MSTAPFTVGNPADLTVLDVAYGMPLGARERRRVRRSSSSVERFVDLLFADCLERGTCYLPFSGGRESSLVLAMATAFMRRHGQHDPVPVSLRFEDAAFADQRLRQEQVIAYLGLDDWERVGIDGQLDVVGSVAQRMLLRTGPVWPANAHMVVPLIEVARDGIFVLATGLTDFFSFWRWAPLAGVVAGQRRPRPDDLRLLAGTLMPTSLRARHLYREMAVPAPWLRASAERRARAMMARRQADVPVRFDRAIMEQTTHRCFHASTRTFQAISDAVGTTIVQPLCRDEVLVALAGAGGWRGFGGQGAMIRRLCNGLLPNELLVSHPMPSLAPKFFEEPTRRFAQQWDGAGLDESLVDSEALRRTWLSERPDPRTGCLLQFAWLSEQVRLGGDSEARWPPHISQPTTEVAA